MSGFCTAKKLHVKSPKPDHVDSNALASLLSGGNFTNADLEGRPWLRVFWSILVTLGQSNLAMGSAFVNGGFNWKRIYQWIYHLVI
jgi:hypothetical protein